MMVRTGLIDQVGAWWWQPLSEHRDHLTSSSRRVVLLSSALKVMGGLPREREHYRKKFRVIAFRALHGLGPAHFCLNLISHLFPHPVPLSLLAPSRVRISRLSATLAPFRSVVSTRMSPLPSRLVLLWLYDCTLFSPLLQLSPLVSSHKKASTRPPGGLSLCSS